jgi:hypothetical protein
MSESLFENLANLKALLLELQPTGERGFEGLIGAALREITGIPFRLAASGLQGGIDGKAAFDGDDICFEGKLYNGAIPRAEVITKIADLTRNGVRSDLVWVLGATSQVQSQLADQVRADGRNSGVSVLILDWATSDIPPLAITMAMGGERVAGFLKTNLQSSRHLDSGLAALEYVRAHAGFPSLQSKIGRSLDAPTMGAALARDANTAWFAAILSDKHRARDEFGQPLAPGDASAKVRFRIDVVSQIQPFLTGKPDGTVVCIHGGEGCGKSWAAMHSWMELSEKPLLVFVAPDEFDEIAARNDIEALLVRKFIAQMEYGRHDGVEHRWRARLDRWRSGITPDAARFIVVIDGVNQRPGYEWGKIITKVSNVVHRLGGRVLFTARAPYYRTRIKKALSVGCQEIPVPEWTTAERDEILKEHGVVPGKLNPAVARTLCNPRLLAIALDLFDADDVAAFEELSVSRLLFEHIRAGVRDEYAADPVDVFVDRLRSNANEMLERVVAKEEEDLNIFEADTPAVAGGHFFHPVEGEPTKYELRDDGLTLALGYALIERLRRAKRNGGDLEAVLELLLEPVAALDDTADVLLAALTVAASDDDEYAPELAAALVKAFAELQNPDETKFPAFVGLAKSLPQDFLSAVRDLFLGEAHQPNTDWVEAALFEASKKDAVWRLITAEIRRWLSWFSLAPTRSMFSHPGRDPEVKIREGREKQQAKIKERLDALSKSERAILARLSEMEGDLGALSRLCFKLLAGKPLAPFAEELVNWSFGESLNPALHAAEKEFVFLISFNRCDWNAARTALLDAARPLRNGDTSRTGQWALVRILRATGESTDDAEANDLAYELTKDRPHFPGWRLLEKYSAADPCDPATASPDNIATTTREYEALDVRKLRQGLYSASEDHFFVDARPAVGRFAPDIAVAKHREFSENVLTRTGMPLRQGLLELRVHNALMTPDQARRLVERCRKMRSIGSDAELTERDRWLVMQYCLLLAFPLLNADQRAEILVTAAEGENVLLELMDVMRAPDEAAFERLLDEARRTGNVHRQHLLLEIAKATDVGLSADTRAYVCSLPGSVDDSLRASALGLIVHRDDEELLSAVAQSTWIAERVDEKYGYELWYGSLALLKAAARGLIDDMEALSRISPRLYGRAATMLGKSAALEIARRVDFSIQKASGLEDHLVAPDIEIRVEEKRHDDPAHFSLSAKEPPAKDFREAMARFSENNDEFEARQHRAYESYLEFRDGLTLAKALIILDNLSLEEFKAIAAVDDGLAAKWCDLFLTIAEAKLPTIHNLVLLLAHATAEKNPEAAEALFRRISNSRPLVRFTFGSAGIDLGAMAAWSGPSTSLMDRLRRERLDAARNDHELALEVLAALKAGHCPLLESFVAEKVESDEPAEVARGIMVAGFSDENAFNDAILARFASSSGLAGDAWKAAQYAYERNRWSRHWFGQMCIADDSAEFWRAGMLFLKIVDGRFSLWRSGYDQTGAPIASFASSVGSRLRNRYENWEKNRAKKLFGRDAPDPVFLIPGN